jgi:hypothetical protein
MTRLWTRSTTAIYSSATTLYANRWVRFIFLTVFYLAILVALVVLYGKGDFSTPKFIYQQY